MFSIYTSAFNIESGMFDWKKSLDIFSNFGEQVVVGTTAFSNDNSCQLLREYSKTKKNVKVVVTDFSLDDMAFDGKIKNAALKECNEPFCILLDLDEMPRLADKLNWINLANHLNKLDYDAFFIPVIDLFNTEREYKSFGVKWYLHKNLENLQRGVVDFAWVDNAKTKIRINQSDTCELCYTDGTLCRTISLIDKLTLFDINNLGIKIFHLGWLDKQKRLLANQFWGPVWSSRAGRQVTDIIDSIDELNKIEYWPHGLKLWYE